MDTSRYFIYAPRACELAQMLNTNSETEVHVEVLAAMVEHVWATMPMAATLILKYILSTVVLFFHFRVGEHFVRLANVLEHFFGLLLRLFSLARMLVGVPLDSQFAVCALHLPRRSVALESKDFVISRKEMAGLTIGIEIYNFY